MNHLTPTHLARLSVFLVVIVAFACGGDDADELYQPNPPKTTCKTSSDCAAPSAVCDVENGTCVQCLNDTHCDGGARCISNRCVAPTGCTSSLDCVNVPHAPICDPSSQNCVPCVGPEDCSGTADCIKNQCVPYHACQTSLDCPPNQVCASLLGRCVECETDFDCPTDHVCLGNSCEVRTPCVSDTQCTPQGKLCDKSLGYCVECMTNQQCHEGHHCAQGVCRPDECDAGESTCKSNALLMCDPQGHRWMDPVACGSQTTCVVKGKSASCEPWICMAGTTACDGDKVVECSKDGMTIISSVDCSVLKKHCLDGECSDLACTPNSKYCVGAELRQCNAAGSDYSVLTVCEPKQVCNSTAGACVNKLCEPGQPACGGERATKCNAAGDGYESGGTNCASSGKSCSQGACVGCPANGAAPTQVRMTEVYLGVDDYIVLKNQGSCPAQLDTLRLRVMAQYSENSIELDLPPFLLGAGASVYVIDEMGAKPGDISSKENIYLTADSGENVMLCEGSCATGTVLDFFSHASGAPPPAPPPGITFTPGPLTGITNSTENDRAYVRTAFSGSYPAFKASDWQEQAASRAWENPTSCPALPPDNSTPCSDTGLVCSYGTVLCYCVIMWVCQ
ncbi:MAG TPA: hypothetical protein PKW66_07810 [Polyangiaceae bacterium]|nr:hypothetical protein [Polyangiaceae bacterium]